MSKDVVDGSEVPCPQGCLAKGGEDVDPQSVVFKVERLKFILQQIDQLNRGVDKHIATFQVVFTGIVTAVASIYVGASKLGIEKDVAAKAMAAMVGVSALVSAFMLMLLVSGVCAWLEYRNDEADILDEMVRPGYRRRPSVVNFWRWHETYFALLVVCAPVGLAFFVTYYLIPSLK